MRRSGIVSTCFLAVLFSLRADEKPSVVRGGIDGKEFSEVGRLYVDDDKLIHFRSDQRLYYFSHMYYIWDTLAKADVVADSKIIHDKPIRITGNYSKAAYVYNSLEEPALRGSQIVWIDRVERVESLPEKEKAFKPLFDGESLKGWSSSPAWLVKDNVISCSAPTERGTETLISQSSHSDFELSFEYRCSWKTSASLLLRASEKGEGIALSLDHIDGGTIGFPKFAAGASRPFTLHETREQRGVGANRHYHIQYDGRFHYDAVAQNKLLECCQLNEFLREWDGAFWNIVRVRCVGLDPEVTIWINGFLVSKFKASTVVLREKTPPHIGAIERFGVHPSGHIGFAVHASQCEETEWLLREVRLVNVDR
jgi:hypothetical protein